MRRRPENMWNKVQRFSIRKFSFGVTSALVGTFFLANASMVQASSIEKEAGIQKNQLEINKVAEDSLKENKVEVKKEKTVEKNHLSEVINELTDILATVNKDKVSKSSLLQFETALSQAKSVLQNESATQEEVDSVVRSLKNSLSIIKSMPKLSTSSEEKEKKNAVPQKETVETASPKTQEEKNASLKQIQKDLQNYLTAVGEKENKETKIDEAKSILANITTQLENPTLSSEELTVLLKQASQVRNSIVNEVLRETSGARDLRNGNKIEEGSNIRAASISSTWDSSDNLLIYQRHRASDGSRVVRNGLREYTEKKVDMFAKTTTIGGERYVVYDVFFNNDGVSMAHLSRYQIYRLILPPQILDLNGNGTYKNNTLKDLKFETYTRNGNSGTLSQNPENFTRTASHNVNFLNNSVDYGSGWRKLTYFNALDIRHSRSYNQDMSETFKGNSNDPLLIHAVTRTESKFNQYSYGFGVKTEDRDSAIHMQVKAKLKAGVTDDQVREAFALAVAGTFGKTTNQAYTFVSGKDANEPKYTDYPDQPVQPTLREKQAKLYPIQGSRHTKVVGDTILNTGNPVADKYITRKGSGDFPAGMSWSWEGNNAPSTANAGKFTYTAIARYQDGSTSKDANSGSDGRVYFTVNPKKPTITTSVVNKKGLTNQTIEVNVGSGVKNGSVVKLYDGDRVIAQGTSNGTTARITVSGALPGNPLKAETTVDNGGVVVSEKSDPVTPTEAPDTQAPTLTITPANQTVVEGQNVTFTVTARDNKHVNLEANDFLTKYGTRVFSGKASITSPTDTETEKVRTITITTTAEDVGKTNTITFNATDNANHRATPVSFTFTVTKRDTVPPTITAGDATVTSREQITPISVTAVDNTGGVGMRDNNPIEVTGLPAGLTYANNRITGTPTGAPGNSTVTIKAYDKNGNMGTKTITITVRSQADAHNPTGTGLTVNQNHTITDAELKAKVSNFAPGTLSIVSRPSTANAGNAGNAVVKVTYPDGTVDNVNVPVTVTDVTGPTITANNATVTSREQITPIPVTAVDNTGGVGMRQNKPIEVTGLPAGLTYANNQITGTPTGPAGNSTVTIKAYDRNNTPTTKTITITVRSQADVHNPTGAGLTVNQNHTITDAELKAKVSNFAPGTLSIVSRPSTARAGNAGNAVVKVTYPDGTFDNVNVPVTVTDVTGPTITANNATVTNREQITPIPVTAVDNTGGVGMRQNNPIEVTGLPAGLTYSNGRITGTPTGAPGNSTVTIKAYDRNNTPTTKTITITVRSQADVHNPTGETLTVPYNHNITDNEVKAKVKNFAPGTLTVKSKPLTNTSGNVGNAVVTVTYPDGSQDTVDVPVIVGRPNKDDYTPKYDDGRGKPGARVEIPLKEENGKDLPPTATYVSDQPGIIAVDNKGKVTVTIPADKNPGDKVTGKITVRYPDGSIDEVPVSVTVVNRDKDNYTPKYADGTGKPGESVDLPLKEENGKDLPPTATYVSDQPGIIAVDNKGKVTVTIPADKNPGDKITGKITVRYPDGSIDEVPVSVTVVNRDKDDYTPKYDDGRGKPGARVEIPLKEENGKDLPPTATYVSDQPGIIAVDNKGKVTVTIPADKNPGDKVTGKITVTYPDGSIDEVPVSVTVINRDKDNYTPKYEDGRGKPGASVDLPLTEENGKDLPPTATYVSDQPGIIAVDNKGKVTVTIPADKNPGDKVTGKITVTYPDGSIDEVPVSVTVIKRDKDDYTPKYDDGTGKPGARVEIPLKEENGKDLPPTATYVSDQPGIIAVDNKGKVTVTIPADKNPGDKVTGKITVTYPDGSIDEVPVSVTVINRDKDDYTPKYDDGNGKPGARVEIPLKEENGKDLPPTATYVSDQPGIIAVDNKGKVTVTIPADKNPGDEVTGKVLVRYPDGSIDEVPVSVTVINRDKDNYTPKYDDGRGKPGARVEIPLKEENGKDLPPTATYTSLTPGVVTVDDKGKVTVTIPADKNPGDEVTGKVLVRYPDGSIDEVPVKVTVVNRDKDDYTPKYDDGNGKPGESVEIPVSEANGKDIPTGTTYTSLTPGVVTVDDKGKVTVTIPADKNPGDEVTGKVLVRYPDGSEEEVPVKVTVVNRDKDDYTPKYDDGNGKPGSKVEIPLTEENGKKIPEGTTFESDQPGVITVDKDGKVTVTIPEGAKPGDKITGKILVRYPDGSTEEIPVTVTVGEQDKDIYTPKYDDGKGKPETKVEIPAKEEQTPAQETPATTGKPVQQTQDTNQNILPNTGTADGVGIFSAAAASILSGLGLVVFGKKEDEEEENN